MASNRIHLCIIWEKRTGCKLNVWYDTLAGNLFGEAIRYLYLLPDLIYYIAHMGKHRKRVIWSILIGLAVLVVINGKYYSYSESAIACAIGLINPSDNFIDLSSETGLTTLIDETNYEIRGQTESEVFYQLSSCAPFKNEKESSFGTAVTNSNINWKYDFTYTKGQVCEIKNIAVGLHINIVMPKWKNQPATNSALTHKWNTFISNLRTHEDSHIEFAKKSANEIFYYLNNLSSTRACAPSKQYIEKRLRSINAELDETNIDYDAKTRHGKTQGAVFNI
ncbi:hypothetical protein A2643_03060 [Candidatus Nomurabacteria bacterium RIFCSPHIGHO2_01_FULL_39_220]|uniref:DUF922 domain-containing protein n=1 Tax=Candidatus Nomurabacteria bacterium RIFCSPLOWO2_02_FULL_40_67 TaxID=1801787 RepID=A0A1F6Y671_9BACT|nr:MAG: hypothetical protein UU01_C0005G0031 [Parcubacteria group bacterium GW2011_GWA2_40_37]KKS11859.1 MAG: hypothetical protein UU66_C0006G0013 [Parcubacteria group bacterium GW2011_GWB1_41_5]OGI61591.1 MAG: hypothetical protein A2W12_03115 [Candidatus Nomurabacteria bacterium RBG_16_40_11]OGI70356.1 MAG: hypothetical protein A2643_03060 [Candidatus Nomurabacteria bacterium RIFCSPHIGHO2_01_FULL_39_220]OGI72496.1 MAG: hypothetical protein A2W56_01190 [Candidatus Nomurabacteria bacterium RIFCS